MKSGNKILFRLGAVAITVAIAVLMAVIGRGHTIYFDSKSGSYNGTEYTAPYKTEVYVGDERVAKLYDGERGMASTMGQSFKYSIEVTPEKGGDSYTKELSLKVPYHMDGVVINIAALEAGLPEEAYLSEFVPVPSPAEMEDEEVITDEFAGLTEGDEEDAA